MAKGSFIFHTEWKEALSRLPAQVRLEVYDAIIEYGLSGTLVELKATAELAFSFVRSYIDADRHREESIRKKRSEAGKRHKGNQHSRRVEQSGTNGTSVPTELNKCSKTSVDKGISEDLKNGTSVPTLKKQLLKESTLSPPDEEKPPETPKEVKPPYTPQENLPPVSGARRFVKPGIEDIRVYCQEKGYAIDAEQFWNFYESKGWLVGKAPMKNWKAACVTWNKRHGTTTQTHQQPRPSHDEHPTDSELQRFTAAYLAGRLRESGDGPSEVWREEQPPF